MPAPACGPSWETAMTDEQMDARLQAAGSAWRATTDRPSTPMPSEPVRVQPPAPPRRHRHTAWLVSAALVAAALIAGGSFLIVRTTGTDDHRVGAESAALKGTVWR